MRHLTLLAKFVFFSFALAGTIYLLFFSQPIVLPSEPFIVPIKHVFVKTENEPIVYSEEYINHQISSTTQSSSTLKIKKHQKEELGYFQEDVPILMYHYIEEAPTSTKMAALYLSPAIFEEQLQAMKANNYNTVFASEVALSLRNKKKLPARSLALTFDDGYEDFYDNVYPLLKKYDIKATLYVIINRIEQPGYVNETELKEMAASKFIEFGSHTFSHPDLKLADKRQAEWEVGESKRGLSNITGHPVLTIAYPFGRYNYEDVAIASSTGYLGAVTVDHGYGQSENNLFVLKRLRPDDRRGPIFAKWLNRIFAGEK